MMVRIKCQCRLSRVHRIPPHANASALFLAFFFFFHSPKHSAPASGAHPRARTNTFPRSSVMAAAAALANGYKGFRVTDGAVLDRVDAESIDPEEFFE
jgi:hypothetical protein